MSGTPGCVDRYGYAVDGATVTFVGVPSTGEPCDPALADDEAAYARQLEFFEGALLGGAAVAFDGETLELYDGVGGVLRFFAVRP